MRILQVITSLNIGGAEHLVVQLLENLRKRGHEVDLCLFNGTETPLLENVMKTGCKIFKFGTGYYNPRYVFYLSHIMREYDVVHSHNSSPQLFSALAKGRKKCRLFTTEHNTDNRKRHFIGAVNVERWMYSKYEKIICISSQTENKLSSFLGDKWMRRHGQDKIVTIENGIDIRRFRTASATIERDSQNVIVMVAAFRPQKDHSSLLRAIKLLPNDYKLWLVGDGKSRNNVEEEIKRLNIGNRVRLFGNRRDVPEIIKSADVVVMSSNWEGFGLSAVEGMAAGKPVIASDVDGLKQIVEGYGVVFPKNNEIVLAKKIQEICENKKLYQQLSYKCFKRAEKYDILAMVDNYEALYQKLI